VGSRNPERDKPPMQDWRKLLEWVQDYPSWTIIVLCKRCAHSGLIRPRQILKHRTRVKRIGDLKARLICKECGERLFILKADFQFRRE
jgi:hypothetical protein